MRLILASASPRRAELLTAAGVRFVIDAVETDEAPQASETARDYVQRIAAYKAMSGSSRHPDDLVLGADTTVVLDGELLGKPADDRDAAGMLRRLSGRSHEVLTGFWLMTSTVGLGGVESTMVWMSPLSEEEIAWYVASGEPRDKAGAYAIQGLASRFITRIEGSYSNVVGLPVDAVFRVLKRFKVDGVS